MESIYQHIRNQVKWNGNFDFNANSDLSKVYRKGEGTSGELNLLLLQAFKRAGLQAEPILIKTNNLGKPETVYPVYKQFNHVIIMVTIGNENYLVDATGENHSISQLPQYCLNTTGWLVDNKEFGWIDIK
ncbi:MAG: hypothetical protein HC906_05910 [Bacteroidales bacterium]|nr:hypothetical protein [Bacteroidales bacterium]